MESCGVQLCCYAIYQIDENDHSSQQLREVDMMNANGASAENTMFTSTHNERIRKPAAAPIVSSKYSFVLSCCEHLPVHILKVLFFLVYGLQFE